MGSLFSSGLTEIFAAFHRVRSHFIKAPNGHAQEPHQMGAAHSKRNLLETKDMLLSRFSHAPIPNSQSKAFNLPFRGMGARRLLPLPSSVFSCSHFVCEESQRASLGLLP